MGLCGLLCCLMVSQSCNKGKSSPAPSKAPTMGATTVSTVTHNSAALASALKTTGFNTSQKSPVSEYGFVYGQTENPTDNKQKAGAATENPVDFTAQLTSLTPGVKYFVRSYVVYTLDTQTETAYGEQTTFTTQNLKAPDVSTNDAADITASAFSITGKLTALGTSDVVQTGHVLSAGNQTPTLSDTKTEMGGSNAVPKDFKSVFTGLQPNTTYYVRAYATNATGTGYSEVKSIKTANVQPPGVTTGDISNVTTTGATVGMNVISVGTNNSIQAGVCWSSSNQQPTTNDSKTSNGANSTQFFSNNLTSLTPNTIYYVRAYATSKDGTGYGDVKSFKTAAVVPPIISAVKRESALSCKTSNTTQAFYNDPCGSATIPSDPAIQVSFTYQSQTETPSRFGICLQPDNQSGEPDINSPKVESGNAYASTVGGYFSARFNVLAKTGNTKTVNCGTLCCNATGPCFTPCGNQTATEYIIRNPFALQYSIFLVGGGTKKGTAYKYRAYIVMTNGNVYYGPTATIDPIDPSCGTPVLVQSMPGAYSNH